MQLSDNKNILLLTGSLCVYINQSILLFSQLWEYFVSLSLEGLIYYRINKWIILTTNTQHNFTSLSVKTCTFLAYHLKTQIHVVVITGAPEGEGVILLDVKVISCYNITVVLVVRLIPLPINSKKKCKDAKKSLTARQAGKIDAFTGSIPAIYIRCTTRSQRSNNAKSSPFLHPTPLCHCLPAKEWLSILVRGRGVCMCVCVGFTCQRWTECPVSWSSAESQGDAGTRCQRACLWIQGTAVKLQWQQTCAINGRLLVKANSDTLINHPVLIKHIVRHGNYVYVDSTTVSPIRPVRHCNVFVCSITAAFASIPLCYSITSQQIDFITVDASV